MQLAELGTDQDKVYQFVQEAFNCKFSIYWLKPIGFNNACSVMMHRQQAKELKLETISYLTSYLQE